MTTQFRVGLLSYKIIAWIGIVFFMFCAIMSWLSGQGNVSPWFLPFVALGIYMLLSLSHLELNEEKIAVVAPFAKYEIRWDEVEWVETSQQGTLVFHGIRQKRLVFAPPSFWSGADKPAMYKFLVSQLEQRKLLPVPSNTADYKTQKNVRVYDNRG